MTTAMTPADVRAHVATQGAVRSVRPAKPKRTVLESFPAGAPRGHWLAEESAREQRREGVPAFTVMDIATDSFLVVVEVSA
jgi:hypothetical protein